MINNRDILKFCIVPSLFLISCSEIPSEERPNILLVMADDMGYSDLNCFGGEINTPNLDLLAQNGVRYTQFYNTARCCPTRASLMTGLYPHEAGVGHMTHVNNGPGYQGYLNDSCYTIAEVLTDAGYYTAMSGKWHSGAVRQSWPENRGFQNFFGIHHWVDSYFKVLYDCEIFEDGKMVISETEKPELYAENGLEWYTTDVFTNKAIEYMNKALNSGKPFFQYVAYNAPHWPLEAHDDIIEKYLDSYSMGYEKLREEKFLRMKEMGILDKNWELPEVTSPAWDSQSDSVKLDLEFRRAIYAAQVEIMDQNIGRMISFLKEKGELENTLIFFLSDNGCSAEPMGEDYGWKWGENTRWNYPDWRNNSARQGASQGRIWAVASNTPFRKYKRFTHEGGISSPLIVHWPNGIKDPGRIENRISHIVDIMATCVDLAGAEYPGSINGVPLKKLRGESFKHSLLNEVDPGHDVLFWEHEGHGALRKGKWKLVSVNPKNNQEWELYDMEKDRTETNNLASTMPELLKSLIEEWYNMALETNVLPWPDYSLGVKNPVDK